MTNGYMNGSAAHEAASAAQPKRRSRGVKPAPAPTPDLWWGLPRAQVVKWVTGGVAALVAAGWITISLPAKQAEVDTLKREIASGFQRMDQGFSAMGEKFRSLDTKISEIREDLVRVQTVQDLSAPTPPPARPARRTQARPVAKPDVKASTTPSVFGW